MICVLQSCNQLAYHTHTSLLLSHFQQMYIHVDEVAELHMGSETISICANYTHTTLLLGNLQHTCNMFVAFCWYRSRLLQACCHGNSEGVVSVLCEEETEEDRTALVNCKSSVSGSPETRSPTDSVVYKQYTNMCENDPLLHSLYYQYMF